MSPAPPSRRHEEVLLGALLVVALLLPPVVLAVIGTGRGRGPSSSLPSFPPAGPLGLPQLQGMPPPLAMPPPVPLLPGGVPPGAPRPAGVTTTTGLVLRSPYRSPVVPPETPLATPPPTPAAATTAAVPRTSSAISRPGASGASVRRSAGAAALLGGTLTLEDLRRPGVPAATVAVPAVPVPGRP